MKQIQAVQMIGTQRSGTNLFRVMLNQLDEVVAPHPPHILQRFSPLLSAYNPSLSNGNFRQLAEDVCRLVEYNPVQWDRCDLQVDKVLKACDSNSLESLFFSLYDQYAKANNANIWVCKSMANMNYFSQLEQVDRKPLYIHMYRDGRDVACSFKKALVGEKHIYHLAKKWKEDQEKSLEISSKLPAHRILKLRYEDLIQNVDFEMQRVCDFMGVELKANVFSYHQSKESKSTASAGEMWSNVTKPVMQNNFNKYRTQLTREEILIFEHVAGDILQELGYELDYPNESSLLNFFKDQINQYDLENMLLKAEAKKSIDPEGLERRKMQDALLQSIQKSMLIKS